MTTMTTIGLIKIHGRHRIFFLDLEEETAYYWKNKDAIIFVKDRYDYDDDDETQYDVIFFKFFPFDCFQTGLDKSHFNEEFYEII